MSQSIQNNLVTEFSQQIHIQAEQMQTRLRSKVTVETVKGKDKAIETLGGIQAVEITTRHQTTQGQEIAHNRRRLKMRRFVATLYLDDFDEMASLVDQRAQYAQAVVRALFRKFDAVVIEACDADVYTGENMTTVVTFANDGGKTVNATSGLTYDKLLEIKENFTNNDVGVEIPEEITLTVSGEEETDMMGEIELTSGDFTRQYAVEGGSITKALGMDVVKFAKFAPNPILPVTSGTRKCFAFTKRGIRAGIMLDNQVKVTERGDLNNLVQVQAKLYMGAVRVDGKHVQLVNTTSA